MKAFQLWWISGCGHREKGKPEDWVGWASHSSAAQNISTDLWGSFFGKAAFAGVLFCLQVKVLFHCHFPGQNIVLETWSPGSCWDWDSLKAPGPGSCVLTVLLSVSSFWSFWKEVCASYLHGFPEDFWLTQSHFNNLFKELKLSSQHKIAPKSTRLKKTMNTCFAINSFTLFATFFTLPLLIVS